MTYTAAVRAIPPGPIYSSFQRASTGLDRLSLGFSGSGSGVWVIAKRVIYVPFWLDQSCTALKMWWLNGATSSGNVDAGIYDSAAGLPNARKVSSGSTAQGTANLIQSVDTTDTFLPGPALYFMAISMDNVTGTLYRSTDAIVWLKALGICQETTGSFGLPATATPVAIAQTALPIFGFSTVLTI